MASTENLSTISSTESLAVKILRAWSTDDLNTTWNSIDYGEDENMFNLTQAMNGEPDLLSPSVFFGFLAVLGFFGNILVLFVFFCKI